ncbi:MAG TPA: pyocin knob domain-containing protein [Candidatus Butyricicoccus avicola]|nr:pyocin knob domain-containing protein [Candidatus Butyricicoccus avicola]
MPEVNLGKVVGPKGSDGAQGPAGADGLSAYEQAQAGGYSGSELEFNQQLAGLSDGPFVPESDKGVASGVATLDSSGKVPATQLPEMNYIPTSQKGAASGVASLDATGKLEETQKPDYTASEVGAVPTARTVNGKAMSADVTLTGDDIPTSASDPTTISSQLSNRLRLPIAIPANASLNDYVSPGMYFCSANAQNVANIPPDSITSAFSLFVEKTGAYGNGVKQTFTEHNPGFTYIRLLSDTSMNHWSDWKLIANATPPQGFDLPLADGISVKDGLSAVYSKNQFGEVVVHGDLVGQMQNGSVLATLPAGFRPIYTLEMPATCDFTAGRIQVNSAGEIRVISQLSECSSLYFLAVFVAGG